MKINYDISIFYYDFIKISLPSGEEKIIWLPDITDAQIKIYGNFRLYYEAEKPRAKYRLACFSGMGQTISLNEFIERVEAEKGMDDTLKVLETMSMVQNKKS